MHNDEFEEINESEEVESVEIREDKIFNNRYNSGDGLTDPEEYAFNNRLSVSSEYSSVFLKDIYETEYQFEYSTAIDDIFEFLKTDPEISSIIDTTSAKTKFSKEDINFIFNKANDELKKKDNVSKYFSPIYVLEAISAISSMEYKKLFDSLDTENQEILVVELNKKYNFLDGRSHKKRIQ